MYRSRSLKACLVASTVRCTKSARSAIDEIVAREPRLVLQFRELGCRGDVLTARHWDAVARVADRILQQAGGGQAPAELMRQLERFDPAADRSSDGVGSHRTTRRN